MLFNIVLSGSAYYHRRMGVMGVCLESEHGGGPWQEGWIRSCLLRCIDRYYDDLMNTVGNCHKLSACSHDTGVMTAYRFSCGFCFVISRFLIKREWIEKYLYNLLLMFKDIKSHQKARLPPKDFLFVVQNILLHMIFCFAIFYSDYAALCLSYGIGNSNIINVIWHRSI